MFEPHDEVVEWAHDTRSWNSGVAAAVVEHAVVGPVFVIASDFRCEGEVIVLRRWVLHVPSNRDLALPQLEKTRAYNNFASSSCF